MKNIELTEEHKSKLLEMCKKLFPEYENIQINNNYDIAVDINEGKLSCPYKDTPDLLWLISVKSDKFEVFHWFEFCMTYLPKKIFGNPKNSFQGINQRPYWCEKIAESFSKVHPVDYLYEEFKKFEV